MPDSPPTEVHINPVPDPANVVPTQQFSGTCQPSAPTVAISAFVYQLSSQQRFPATSVLAGVNNWSLSFNNLPAAAGLCRLKVTGINQQNAEVGSDTILINLM